MFQVHLGRNSPGISKKRLKRQAELEDRNMKYCTLRVRDFYGNWFDIECHHAPDGVKNHHVFHGKCKLGHYDRIHLIDDQGIVLVCVDCNDHFSELLITLGAYNV